MFVLYEIEFLTKTGDIFSTLHTAFVTAISVSECHVIAEEIKEKLRVPANTLVYTEVKEMEN
ncbi:hypothetical protein [Psychrobacillus sp. FSL K6-1464]|uniref:hypothetical protein n=1 Tax=Psychrobacillus sp. FSL K6-1464 TaxID=2921545 RepID=UPI0030F7476F